MLYGSSIRYVDNCNGLSTWRQRLNCRGHVGKRGGGSAGHTQNRRRVGGDETELSDDDEMCLTSDDEGARHIWVCTLSVSPISLFVKTSVF